MEKMAFVLRVREGGESQYRAPVMESITGLGDGSIEILTPVLTIG